MPPAPSTSIIVPAIRFISATKKSHSPVVQLLCHVKPGVNANREGISAVTSDAIELGVAAQPRDGEANKAVREVIAEVLKVPKSDVEVTKGLKSREKTITVNCTTPDIDPEAEVERIKHLLESSIAH